ncbi:MAG: hypothetical protein C0490_00595 [Marivirga sp.]|nr:hypothetical protein [Marivirga sp.]
MRSLYQIVFIFLCHVAWAQPNTIWFDEVVDELGYSIHGVKHIIQDKDGFIWFCHSDGLAKYDGYNFQQYSRKELSTLFFSSKTASLVFEDRKRDLWIVTDAGALMKYTPETDRFILMNDTTSVIKGSAYAFVEDDEQNFWIGSAGGGLYKINPAKNIFKNYRAQKNDSVTINNDFVISLALDRDKQLWVGTTNGLCRYVKSKDAFQQIELTNSNPSDTYRFRVIRSLLFAADDRLYVGTYGGLHTIDQKNNSRKHYFHIPEDDNGLSHNSIFKLQEDTRGHIWVATYGGGLNIFDPIQTNFRSWKGSMAERGRIHTNNLFTIYLDNTGKLWVGGADQGIFLYNPDAKKIYSVGNSAADTSSISPGWIRNVFQENDSIIWIGLNGSGINKYNIKSGKVIRRYVNNPKDTTSLAHNAVVAIDKDDYGNLWFGLEGGGLSKLVKGSDKFVRYMHRPDKNSIVNNAVSSILIADDVIWIATYVSGLDVFSLRSGSFYHFSEDSLKSLDISFSATDKMVEHEGNVWFATHRGIVVFDNKKKIFVKIPNLRGDIRTVAKELKLELRPFAKNEMLINNDYSEIWKINYTDPSRLHQELLWKDTSNLLLDDDISFTADAKKNLWISAASNLTRVDLRKKSVSTFNVTNGITNERRLSGIFTANDGRIFLTGANGFIWFYPDQVKNDNTPVKVVLTELEIFNKPVTIRENGGGDESEFSIPQHIGRLQNLELYYHQNFFSFRFAALAFIHRDKIQYAYQLEGFDRDWVYAGKRRYASYTNLDPGEYTFKVKATNADGYWNEEPTSINVIIHPPFWKTPWFIALMVLISTGFVYFVHRYRMYQSLRVERLRNKIASDLHDEVGSSLTRISIYSDLLQNGISPEERKGYLSGIGELSREVVSTMSDIVWSIDNRNDTLGALIIRMKDFSTEVLQAKNIEHEFIVMDLDEERALDPALKQNIYLIFKESIHNIVKHSKANRVSINLKNKDGRFNMIIKDNGCGFEKNIMNKGNGLRNMHRRAEVVQGEFTISNREGTTLTFIRKAL